MESLITLILLILVIGLALYALRLALGIWPISDPIRTVVEVVILIIIILVLLRWIGALPAFLWIGPLGSAPYVH